MTVKTEISNFWELQNMVWAGASDTLETIADANKADEFMDWLECYWDFTDEIPTMTELNDFLWFDNDFILSELGIETE